jgi:NADPH:quinone reductase-like Zn-dependent oxidoreductase
MRSWFVLPGNDSVSVALRNTDLPVPSGRQVLVKIRAAALNRGEFIAGDGLHSGGAGRPGGFEAAGDVVEVGAEVSAFAVGDRVFGRCEGAFSEFGCMHAGEAFKVPAYLSWEEAAAFPVSFSTAHDILMLNGRIAAGDWLLIAGAASGVGVACMALAHAAGAKVIGTSGSQEKLSKLTELGLDVAIHTRTGDFVSAVMESTGGQGVDWAVNAVGGSVLPSCIESLGYQGRMAIVGYVDGVTKPVIDLLALHKKRLHLYGVSQKMRTMEQREQVAAAFRQDVLPLIENQRVRVPVERTFAFEDLPAAQRFMQDDRHVGKVVIVLDVKDSK